MSILPIHISTKMRNLVAIILLLVIAILLMPPKSLAATTTLTPTDCFLTDVQDSTCNTAISADGGTSTSITKAAHLDVPLQTLSVSSINSATLSYDSSGSLSGTWGVYVKDARDGTTICSIDPAPEDGSETTNTIGCGISTAQLAAGVWVQMNNDDDKGPENMTIDYVRLDVDYNPAVSISLSTNGSVSFGVLVENTTQDTTASGLNDVETVSVDSGPADLDVRSGTFSDGSNTWTLGASSSGSNQVFWEFSPDGSSWTALAVADQLYSLATSVSTSGTQNLYLRLTTPTSTSSFSQHSADVTVVASAP